MAHCNSETLVYDLGDDAFEHGREGKDWVLDRTSQMLMHRWIPLKCKLGFRILRWDLGFCISVAPC